MAEALTDVVDEVAPDVEANENEDTAEQQTASFFVEADEVCASAPLHHTGSIRRVPFKPHSRNFDADFSFRMCAQVLALMKSFSDPKAKHETAADRLAVVLDRYQEQPSILDPSLEGMVTPLLASVRMAARGTGPTSVLPHACRVMYTLCKVRGYKTIVKFCPHEVADLEPLVHLLARFPPEDCASWQIAYSLMVWLSMVVMVPFDLSIIDSSVATATVDADADATTTTTTTTGSQGSPLVQSIERLAMGYLGSTGPAREAGAILLARLLTRPGLQHMLSAFITWGGAELTRGREGGGEAAVGMKASFLLVGIYSALAQIFKLGHRAELLPQLPLLGGLAHDPAALLNDTSVLRRKRYRHWPRGMPLLTSLGGHVACPSSLPLEATWHAPPHTPPPLVTRCR